MLKEYNIAHIDIDVTDECNFNCSYCYHGSMTTRLDQEVKEKIITLIKKENPSVAFFGGEPLFRFETLKEIVKEGQPTKWSVTSNLSLLNKGKEQFFKKNNGRVHCSIDGDQCAHDMYRKFKNGDGSYNNIIKNIPAALRLNPHATARMSVMPETAQYMAEGVISLFDLGFESVAPMPVSEANWGNNHWKEYEKSLKLLAEYNVKHPDKRIKNFADAMRGFRNPTFSARKCGAGFNSAAIGTNGHIYPCHRYTSRHLTKWCIGDIMNGGIDKQALDKFRGYFKEIPKECETCECLFSCSGGCPNVLSNLFDNPSGIEPNHCRYMKLSMLYGRWVYVKLFKTKNVYNNQGGASS